MLCTIHDTLYVNHDMEV